LGGVKVDFDDNKSFELNMMQHDQKGSQEKAFLAKNATPKSREQSTETLRKLLSLDTGSPERV